MKSMALTGLKKIELIHQRDPDLVNEDDVLIRVSHVGVCGSDMHQYNTGFIGGTAVKYPFVLGHEGSGIVEDMGPRVEGLEKGQRIMIEPARPCLQCDQCRSGRTHTCRKMNFLGSPGQSPGLLSEFIVMPAHCCFPLPEHLHNDIAVLSEPLSIGIWATDLAGVAPGATIGILGSGPIGMSVLLYSRYLGAGKIYVTDKLDYRLRMARSAGACWEGNPDRSDIVAGIMNQEPLGLDILFDCCGMQEAMDQAVELVKPGGKIMIVGIPEFERWSLPTDMTRRKELCFQNVRRQNDRLQKALDLISSGDINAEGLLTHRFSFPDTGRAYDLVAGYRDSVMKAVIQFT